MVFRHSIRINPIHRIAGAVGVGGDVVVLLHRARGGVLHVGRKADAVVFDGEGIDNNHKRG